MRRRSPRWWRHRLRRGGGLTRTAAQQHAAKSWGVLLVTRFERIGASSNGGRHRCVHRSVRYKSPVVVVYGAAVVAWAVCVIITRARAYDSPLISRSVVIVGIRVAGRVIRGRIIMTSIIRRHIRTFRTSNHESCNDACANRQQECSTTVHRFGICYRFHQMFPFI